MKTDGERLKAPEKLEANQAAKPSAKDDLRSLPLAEVEEKLASSADGLTRSRGAETAHPMRAERDRRKDDQSTPEIPLLFLGPIPG